EDIFFRIMMDKIEPFLGHERPTILYDYPTCLGALARRKPTDEGVCERFEAYICGVELCNAFSELTDPTEQRKRFETDSAAKQRIYGYTYPIDEDFMQALEFAMGEASGNALGVDRLVMLITGSDDIRDTCWAPVR
ncbi:MAG: amino acid--tRNA ligase-related protein, partial [Alphaproteobacteria bacterium]